MTELIKSQLGRFGVVGTGNVIQGQVGTHQATATVVGSASVSATVVIKGSNDKVGWTNIATLKPSGSGPATAGGSWTADYVYWVAEVTALSGDLVDVSVSTDQTSSGSHPDTFGGSNLIASSWTTAWKTSGAYDLGDYTITGALALTSDDSGSIVGGYTQATLISDGANVPTFDGSNISDWINAAGARNLVQLYRAGNSKFWAVGSRAGASITSPTVPVITVVPAIGTAISGQPLTWTAATATGVPTPAITYEVLIGGSVVASNATSGSYTPSSSGVTATVRATATNSQGTAQSTSAAVTVAAAATAPGAPTALTLGTATSTTQPLTWTAPASNGGSAITDYVVQYSPAGANTWTTFADGTSSATSATVTGLTASTSYDYRVAAVNSVETGSYSATATGSTAAASAPSGTVTRLTSLASFTESGDATNGWSYTQAGGTNYGGGAGGITAMSLPASTDGYIEYTLQNFTLGLAGPCMSLRTSSALGSFNTCLVGIFEDTTTSAYRVHAGSNSVAPSVATVPASGQVVRLERTGTTITAKINGSVINTWTGQSTAQLWAQFAVPANNGITVSNVRTGGFA